MDCGQRLYLPKICAQSDPPLSENADFDNDFRLLFNGASVVSASEKVQFEIQYHW